MPSRREVVGAGASLLALSGLTGQAMAQAATEIAEVARLACGKFPLPADNVRKTKYLWPMGGG